MNTTSAFSTGNGSTSHTGKDSSASDRGADRKSCCDIEIRIDCRGDVNIYNCGTPSGTSQPPDCPPCPPIYGACIPVVAGAKHKLSRDQKLNRLSEGVPVPSALAAGAMHMMRRFLLGKTPANPLEVATFATLRKISRDILSCTLTAFDAAPLLSAIACSCSPSCSTPISRSTRQR